MTLRYLGLCMALLYGAFGFAANDLKSYQLTGLEMNLEQSQKEGRTAYSLFVNSRVVSTKTCIEVIQEGVDLILAYTDQNHIYSEGTLSGTCLGDDYNTSPANTFFAQLKILPLDDEGDRLMAEYLRKMQDYNFYGAIFHYNSEPAD